ncbi:MAG TPA: aminotransferase class IV [Gammaproteobacteria bacterium]|nr:aminotransferase class IV [Gammaproteobacteria bacterium]
MTAGSGGRGSQAFAPDPRNDAVLVWVNGRLVPRAEAVVSVFDAGFVLGDGVWEGLRLVNGRLAFLDEHLDRLLRGAAQIRLDIGPDRRGLAEALYRTAEANGMRDGAHLRLMVTRGTKTSPNQDPRQTAGPATVVITAEYKAPPPALYARGLALATSRFRTSGPEIFDMRLNSHSRLNLIQALLEAIEAGADEALMLDPRGFVASCNATNFFIVRDGIVHTSTGEYCFNGITRGHVVELCRGNDIPVELADFTLEEARAADEAFVTGTFGGVVPVASLDAHALPQPLPGPFTARLGKLYQALLQAESLLG